MSHGSCQEQVFCPFSVVALDSLEWPNMVTFFCLFRNICGISFSSVKSLLLAATSELEWFFGRAGQMLLDKHSSHVRCERDGLLLIVVAQHRIWFAKQN